VARLTEQEQQEVIRFLEADKPLPDKCRFLLFADKREVELVWNGKTSRIVVEKGQIVKVSKDAKGIVKREVLTREWTDWIDYWAVDFNFENKREIIRVKGEETGEWEERWTGDYIFENEWQSFRTKKDRSLELTSVFHECTPGR